MPQKNERMELPSSVDKVVALLARLMFSHVHRVVIDVDNNFVDVRWTPLSDDDELMKDDDTFELSEIFRRVRINESDTDYSLACNSKNMVQLALALQELAVDRKFPLALACADPSELKAWLGLPRIVPIDSFMGIPVKTAEDVPSGAVYLIAGKLKDLPLRSANVIQKINLTREEKDA